MTWEYLGHALSVGCPGAEVWVDIVRGWFLYWVIRRSALQTDSGSNGSARWKRRLRKSNIGRACTRGMAAAVSGTTTLLDKAVTWAIGTEPTDKERMTWTKAPFRSQLRVRYDRSTGQGYNKRRLGISGWHRTLSVICLLATSGKTQATRFDSDSVTLHIDNCASRCITNSVSDFVTAPQKVIGRVKGMGGDKVAVTAIGTLRWTFDDDEGVAHSFLHVSSRLNIGPKN